MTHLLRHTKSNYSRNTRAKTPATRSQNSIKQRWPARGHRRGRSPLVHVDICLLARDVGKATPDTLDGGEGEHDLFLPINVRIQQTQNVLEVLVRDQRLQHAPKKNTSKKNYDTSGTHSDQKSEEQTAWEI